MNPPKGPVIPRNGPAFTTLCLVALVVAYTLPPALAAEITWGNTGQTWNFNSSWAGGAQPANSITTDTALFSNIGAGFNTVKFSADRRIAGVTFSAAANAYTFLDEGFSLTIGSSGIVHGAANTQTLNTLLVLGSSQTWSVTNGGTLSVQAVDLSTNSTSRTLTLAGNGTIAVNGAIANSGGSTASAVTVTATGNTTLAGDNTYGGLTTMDAAAGALTLSGNNSGTGGGVRVTAGALNINSAHALGSGTLDVRNAATLDNTSGAALVNAGNNAVTWGESATGGFTFGTAASTAANNLDLGTGIVTANTTRSMSFAGTGTTLTMGTLEVASTASSARILTADGAGNTLVLRGYNIRSLVFGTAVQDTLAGSANWTIVGVIADGNANANGLRIESTGLTTFSGANTYSGATTVAAGTLQIGDGGTTGSLNAASAITNNATLAFNRSDAVTQGTDFATVVAGTGALVQAGSGSLVLSGTNTYTGATTISAGTLSVSDLWNGGTGSSIGASSADAANLILDGGALLYTRNANQTTDRGFTLTDSTTSTINISNADTRLTLAGTSATTTGSLIKDGAGELRLSGTNTSAPPPSTLV
jgi:autotransporter-associated beta strand protein